MFVHPDARGNGAATELLTAAENAARDIGAQTIRLTTRKDLVEARAFYAKHGYTEIPPYGTDPLADHFFQKELSR